MKQTGSQAHRFAFKRLWPVWLLVELLAATECSRPIQFQSAAVVTEAIGAFDPSINSAGTSRPTIDAGIVLVDQAGYYCLSLERVGLSPDAQILSLESSCDCVQPRLVQYVADREQVCQAILLEFVPEMPSSDTADEADVSKVQPANLGVIIRVGLAGNGAKQDFTVNLIRTVLQGDASFPTVGSDRWVDRQDGSILSAEESL